MLVLPPVNLVFLILAGVALLRRLPRLARWLIGVAAALLLLMAIPAVAGTLLCSLERNLPMTPPADRPPGAIVILGAEVTRSDGSPPGVTAGRLTLERLRAGAALQRKTGLPILVSGGRVANEAPSIAEVMRESLTQDFQVPVRWTENRSRDTWQNAQDSAAIPRAAGIGSSIYLVTHSWHERRALIAFAATGLTVTVAPTPLDRWPRLDGLGFHAPSVSSWQTGYYGPARMGRLHLVCLAMTVRLQEFASLDALPAESDRLFAASPGLFHSRAWWRTVVSAGMPEGTRPCFLLAWADAVPAALFPLRRPAAGSALESLTTPYTCDYAPLLSPGLSVAAQGEIFAAFARFCRGWATTRLDALPDDWPAIQACLEGARKARLPVVRFAHFGNWHEDVQGLAWSGYLARRPGALRETIRRKLRRGERRPDGSFTLIDCTRDLEPGIEAFAQVYAKSWKEPEPFPNFNAGLMRETAAAGMLRLGLWRIGGVPVAAQFWIVQDGTASVLKLAHDEAFQADSPGTVLTALMLRTLLDEEHVRAIDFGRGDDAYKQGWASQRRQRIGLVLINPRRPAGLAFLARHGLGRLRARLTTAAGRASIAQRMPETGG